MNSAGTRNQKDDFAGPLPFETDTDLLAARFGRQHGQRRAAFGQAAFAGLQVKTVAVVVTANLPAAKKLAGLFEISFLMRAVARECEIATIDERQQDLASPEIDFFHDTGG